MTEPSSWIMLSMQLPSKPAYVRVKLWRQLREAGAISLAGGVYALPDEPRHREVLLAIANDASAAAGQAAIFSGVYIGGTDDPGTVCRSVRTADYESWIADAEGLIASDIRAVDVGRMRRRLEHIHATEFVLTGLRERACGLLRDLVESSLRHPDVRRSTPGGGFRSAELHGRVWVTRRGVGVDRIASAWLIQRFIDPRPRFRFVDPDRYLHQRRELRFDMADGEFTHEGDLCSFETLLLRSNVDVDKKLERVAMIIHDLDIEDGRYDLPQTKAVAETIRDLCARFERDEDRVEAGSKYLDDVYRSLM